MKRSMGGNAAPTSTVNDPSSPTSSRQEFAPAISASSSEQLFGPRDEEREWAAVTPDEMREIESDLKGLSLESHVYKNSATWSEDGDGGKAEQPTGSPEDDPVLIDGSRGTFQEGLENPLSCATSDRCEDDSAENSQGALTDAERELEMLPELEREMAAIPEPEKEAYLEATRRCPKLVNDDHKRGFLLRENFNAKLAAKRLARHWQYKLKLFGPTKCFLPMTLRGAMSDDLGTLSRGFPQILPTKDAHGRTVFFFDPSLMSLDEDSKESMLRAQWYLNEIANENPSDRRCGVVLLVCPKNARRNQFDPVFHQDVMSLSQVYNSNITRAIHLCHPDPMYHLYTFVQKFQMGPWMRKRFKVHSGSTESVLDSLSKFGLKREGLPSEMGGDLKLDPVRWVWERMAREEGFDALTNTQPNNGVFLTPEVLLRTQPCDTPDIDALSLDKIEPIPVISSSANEMCSRESSPDAQDIDNDGEVCQAMATGRMRDRQSRQELPQRRGSLNKDSELDNTSGFPTQPSNSEDYTNTPRSMNEVPFPDMPNFQASSGEKEAFSSLNPKSSIRSLSEKKTSGKKKATESAGDARMTRAVEAKLANPKMSLLDALLVGGFDLPHSKTKGQTDRTIKDAEGVTLHQRKNQLCRRLRDYRVDDPRMSRAVSAKVDNPKLPLEDALIAGGFVFPDLGQDRGDIGDRKARDLDNVTLFSRKKELMKKLAALESTGAATGSNFVSGDKSNDDLSSGHEAGQHPMRTQL